MTPAEQRRRRKGIGASESPAVLGVSPHTTALDIWGRKVGVDVGEPPIGPQAAWGTAIEPLILARFAADHGAQLETRPRKVRLLAHPSEPILFASPDAIDVEARRLVEAKVDRFGRGWGESGSDEVPLRVRVQVLHQLEVTGLEYATVAALIGGTDYREFEIERSTVGQQALVEALREWWDAYVFTRQPPDDEPSEYARYLRSRYRQDDGTELVATPRIEKLASAYRSALDAVELAELTALQLRNEIEVVMGKHAHLLGRFGRIDWKATKAGERTDWKLVARDLEQLIAQISLGTLPLSIDPVAAIDTIKSLHTEPRVAARPFVPRWHDNGRPQLEGEPEWPSNALN